MPAPKSVAKSEVYVSMLNSGTFAAGETNDCAVRAIAVAADRPYAEVLAKMTEAGRSARKGTQWHIIWGVLASYGLRAVPVSPVGVLASRYPNGGKGHKTVTTHHADRYNKVWADGKTYLWNTKGHILCVKNGVNHDWTRGRAKEVIYMWEVVPA